MDLVRGICGAHEGYETAEVRDGRIMDWGARAAWGGKNKNGWCVSWMASEEFNQSVLCTDAGRDCRTRLAKPISRANEDREIFIFPGSADHEQD